MEIPNIVTHLDGYLQCLRRLSNNACDFWANAFEFGDSVEKGLERHLQGHDVILGSSRNVSYAEISLELEQHVFGKVTCVSEDQKKLIEWDVIEFIEMACREIEEDSNPIHSGKAMLFNAKSEFHGEYIYLVIPVANQAIIVGFATRA